MIIIHCTSNSSANPSVTQMHNRMKTQAPSKSMWPAYAIRSRVYILPTEAGLLQGRSSLCRCVSEWVGEVCLRVCFWTRGRVAVASTLRLGKRTEGKESHNTKKQRDNQWNSCLAERPEGNSQRGFVVSPVKHQREQQQQQCFSASLGWPLDILDTSRYVRCFEVIFFFG